MTGALDRGPAIIETDKSLADYTRSLLLPDSPDARTGFGLIDEVGPFQVQQVFGQTRHRIVVNYRPDGDHDDIAEHIARRMGNTWRPFAIAYNPEAQWEITHWEPVADARPLQ